MRLSPEERQRRSNHMKAILANRKALKGMLAQPDGEPAKWIDKGNGRIIDTSAKVDAFPIGTTVRVTFVDPSPLEWAGVTAKTAAWLRRLGAEEFVAFAMNCTHLGCPVRWLADARLFLCPCHGGVYNGDGSVAAGPPPKPLPRYPVRVRQGRVEILTSPLPVT